MYRWSMNQKYTLITRKCPECDIDFTCKSGGKEYKNCCSRQCSNKQSALKRTDVQQLKINESIRSAAIKYLGDRAAKEVTVICKHCSVTFTYKSSVKIGRVFCSRPCADSHKKMLRANAALINPSKPAKRRARSTVDTISLVCEECRITYLKPKYRSGQRFCSLKCLGHFAGKKSAALKTLRSKNEILFYDLCLPKYPDTIHNQPIFDGWDADVIIPSLKLAILWNGVWHYKDKLSSNHSLKQVQSRDRIKLEKIKEHGYESYVIKDMGKHNPDFVNQEFEKFLEYISSHDRHSSTG